MMSKRRVLLGSAAMAAMALAGCSSSESTGPSSGNTLDLSALISEMAYGTGSVAAASAVGGLPVAATPPVVPSSCQYSAATQGFNCATLNADGLTISATFYLLDAAGHFQSQADASTTDALRTVTDVNGTVKLDQSVGTGSMTLVNHQDVTLSGLLSGTHVLNGTATSHADLTLTAPSAMHTVVDGKSVTVNVTLPKSGATNHWPTSGTITTDATTATQLGSQSVTGTTHSVLTFNGSSTVTVTTTISAGSTSFSTTCKVDLAGASAPVCN
jgi:hypothetical protein